MLIWGAMLIPIGTALVLYFCFQHRTLWWEFMVPLAGSAIFIFICKVTTETVQTRDKEFWGGKLMTAEYYERWDERVPCRHPKYKTVRESVRQSDGSYKTVERQVQDGYKHAYDVDDHPPHWKIHDSNDSSQSVSSATFEVLAKRFSSREFVDLHRSYHSVDGDKYVATWPGDDATLVPVTTLHAYENRVQASTSLFNFDEVDPEDYSLFEYPKVKGYSCPVILGDGGPTHAEAERLLGISNSRLGKPKQIRFWILIFKGQPRQAGFDQENYWKGGNKNEFILTIGVDKQHNVKWCHPISWTEVEGLKIDARNFVTGQQGKPLDLVAISSWLHTECKKRFIRKEFKDFDYLTVDPPGWVVALSYLLTLVVNAGISFWIVYNEHHEGSFHFRRPNFRFRRIRF